MFFFCFCFQIEKIWLWLSFTMQQFDVYWAVLENMLFGSKRVIKSFPKSGGFYLLSIPKHFFTHFWKIFLTKKSMKLERLLCLSSCNSPVKNNGLPFPSPYDLVAAAKMRREYFKDEKSRCMDHQMITFMYFTRISSPFHSIVFNVLWWHSECIVSNCIAMLLKAWELESLKNSFTTSGFANTIVSLELIDQGLIVV